MKGWRTILFNMLAAIMPVMEAAGADLGLTGNKLVLYTTLVTLGNVILRMLTTTAVGRKE